jgi:transposase
MCACGHSWDSVEVSGQQIRQVHDLPEIRLRITEFLAPQQHLTGLGRYQAHTKTCPNCQHQQQAHFPESVPGYVQYGPRVHALGVYLNAAHFVPLERTSQILNAICGANLSDGTIVLNLNLATQRLAGFEDDLKAALQAQPVLHADETGSKVNGKLHWLHVVCSARLTLYGHHANRGFAALEAMNVLPQFLGVVVHDAWRTYFQLPCKHALCNAHLLRELRGLAEHEAQVWAGELRGCFQGVYQALKTGALTSEVKEAFLVRFDALLEAGLLVNPAGERVEKRRGRIKQSRGRNLALRCQLHRNAVLRFLDGDGVPFDNNLAEARTARQVLSCEQERDIRMVCVKRKVSGGFRSVAGGMAFCRLRSYISTLGKQGLNVWDGLVSVFRGNVLMPNFSS